MSTHDESAGDARQRSAGRPDSAAGPVGIPAGMRSGVRSGVGSGVGAGDRLRPHRHVGGRFLGGGLDRARHEGARHEGARHEGGVASVSVGVGSVGVGSAAVGVSGRMAVVWDGVSRLERRLAAVLRRGSVPALRIALSLVFVWFGALKVTGESPVGSLVAGVAPWLPRELFISGLGVFEVLLGVALLLGYRLVWVALLMVAHLAGTFLVFLTEPAAAFSHGNPLLVTMAGEFVAKNMVLIAAGLVVVAFAHEHRGPLAQRA
jgi:putative oxidoreductase